MKTVKDLRAALKGLPGSMPLLVDREEDWEVSVEDTWFVDGKPAVVVNLEPLEDDE